MSRGSGGPPSGTSFLGRTAPQRCLSLFLLSSEQSGTWLGPAPVLIQSSRLHLSSIVSWVPLRNPTPPPMTETKVPLVHPAPDGGRDVRKLRHREGRSGAGAGRQGSVLSLAPSPWRLEQAFTSPGLFPTHETRKLDRFMLQHPFFVSRQP